MTPDEARAVLDAIDAPPRLRNHGELVAEAARELLGALRPLMLHVDAAWVECGALLHDAGKALHPSELDAPGAEHEEAGRRLLLARGVEAKVARCCISHAQWAAMDCALEELLVALADALWKGVRRPELEGRVIDAVATIARRDRWEVFVALDDAFERIADEGPARLMRSRGR